MRRLFDAAFINTSALKCGVYSTAVFNRINTVLLRKLFKEERTKISVFHISPASLPLPELSSLASRAVTTTHFVKQGQEVKK